VADQLVQRRSAPLPRSWACRCPKSARGGAFDPDPGLKGGQLLDHDYNYGADPSYTLFHDFTVF